MTSKRIYNWLYGINLKILSRKEIQFNNYFIITNMIRLTLIAAVLFTLSSCNNLNETKSVKMDNTAINKTLIEKYFQLFNNHEWPTCILNSPKLKTRPMG